MQDFYTVQVGDDARETYILKFCNTHNKSKASVISKLSKMRIYIPRPKVSKVTGGTPETKALIINDIAMNLGCNPEQLEGMDKTPKLVLLLLRSLIAK